MVVERQGAAPKEILSLSLDNGHADAGAKRIEGLWHGPASRHWYRCKRLKLDESNFPSGQNDART